MPAYLWITVAAAVALVLWVAFGRRWLHSLWYSWTAAVHVNEQARRDVEAATVFYGSMDVTAEQALHHELPVWLPAPPVDPEPWRQQIAHELAPETIGKDPLSIVDQFFKDTRELEEIVLPDAGGWISGPCLDDLEEGPTVSGPEGAEGVNAPLLQQDTGPGGGLSLVEPSPSDPGQDWLGAQMAVTFAWVRSMVPQVTGWSVAA